ncbi:MAG: DUF3037 domain-containing protein [Ferruginibacter sp.]
MQEKNLFEYAVIRVVPKVEREEFLNIGVILYCAKQQYLQTRFQIDNKRLADFCGESAIPELGEYLKAFEQISMGEPGSGAIGKLPIAERFRWLTATRSTVLQTSKLHPGLCADAGGMLEKLFAQLVLTGKD